MISKIINTILTGAIPLALGIYLILLSSGKLKFRDAEQERKVRQHSSKLRLLGWIVTFSGLAAGILAAFG